MPTYLTPGVYVEEVPSTSKPIEGVGTSIAAFVGLAPGGPVNTPMRISNWTQFAKIFGDPNEPDNGPFMEGALPRARRLRLLPERRRPLLGRARRRRRRRRRAPAGGAAGGGRQVDRGVPRRGAQGRRRRRQGRAHRGAGAPARAPSRPTSSSSTPARDGKEEYDGLTLKKGRQNLATKVNPASKFIKITEAAGLPDARPATGTYTLSAPSVVGRGASRRPTSRATSPAARAWAAWPPSTRSRWSACRTR